MKQSDSLLLIGNKNCKETVFFAKCLGADFLSAPELPKVSDGTGDYDWHWSEALEQWREKNCSDKTYKKIVVAIWQQNLSARSLVDTNFDDWVHRCEVPIAWWTVALGCAQSVCYDGGAVVAIIEQPAVLDAENWTPEVAVAEAVVGLIKSLALSDVRRDISFNAVTTSMRMSSEIKLADSQSLLSSSIGRLADEVVGVVKLFLDDNASGLTGKVLNVDYGRRM
tara:strand:+ start:1867 stop:2538 length:672 start_codon:yes stop_codon:yes gene_type:complete